MDSYGNNGEYEGTLSSLTRYGTMDTPSLKTARERKGKYRAGKRDPRTKASVRDGSIVKVTYADGSSATVQASAFERKARVVKHSPQSEEAQAWMRAQADYRLALRARVAGNEQAL